MKNLGLGLVAAVAMASIACGSSPSSENTLHVTGAVSAKTRSLDNARAMAFSSDGHVYSAFLTKTGKFKLDLPVGHVYRIAIANGTSSADLRIIGHVMNTTTNGDSPVIAVHEGGNLALGTLTPASAKTTSLHTACACSDTSGSGSDDKGGGDSYGDKGDDSGSDQGDDNKDDQGESDDGDGHGDYSCHQKDDDADKCCDDGADVPLKPSHAPGDKCAAGDDDEAPPQAKTKGCGSKDGDHDGKDDDGDGSGSGDTSGSGSDGSYGGGSDSSGAGDKPSSDGTSSSSSSSGGGAGSCTCSKECGSGSACVAGYCTPSVP